MLYKDVYYDAKITGPLSDHEVTDYNPKRKMGVPKIWNSDIEYKELL